MQRHIKSRKYFVTLIWTSVALLLASSQTVYSQRFSYDPNTDNDGGEEFSACLRDIKKYCNFWTPFLFELENCLQLKVDHLTPACRSQLGSTDFRKYHKDMRPQDF